MMRCARYAELNKKEMLQWVKAFSVDQRQSDILIPLEPFFDKSFTLPDFEVVDI